MQAEHFNRMKKWAKKPTMDPMISNRPSTNFAIVPISHGYKLQVPGTDQPDIAIDPNGHNKKIKLIITEPQNILFLALELAFAFFIIAVIPIPISIISNANIRICPIGTSLICILLPLPKTFGTLLKVICPSDTFIVV